MKTAQRPTESVGHPSPMRSERLKPAGFALAACLILPAVLAAGGSSLRHVVKTTVFMVDLGEFARMNAVYATFFSDMPPARSTVQVAALPAGGRVEVEAIALACDCGCGEEECDCGCGCGEEECGCS